MKFRNFVLIFLLFPAKTHQTIRTASVIGSIADWYETTCIVLFRSDNVPATAGETEETFRILKLTFENMVAAEIAELTRPSIAYRWDSNRCPRILYVVDDRRNNIRAELEELSHSVEMGGPIWLVFLPITESPNEYLKNMYIPFNADFVAAETHRDTIVLNQFYRVSASHALRTIPFGSWSEEKDLVVDCYSPRWHRADLEGKVFRVSAIENWPLTVVSGTRIEGYFGMVWRDLQERLNFSTVYVKPNDSGPGVWNGKEWNGLTGMIVRGEIDVAISEITMTTGRLDVVDFLKPLYATRYQLFFKPPGLMIQWDLILRPFETEVWVTLLIWFGATTVMLVVSYRIGVLFGLEDPKPGLEYQCLFLIVSALFQQAVTTTPKSICCRFVLATTYLFSTIIVIIYSCTLTSMIATQKPIRPFDSLESFLEDGTYTLEQIPGSDSYAYFSNSTDRMLQEIYKNLFSKIPQEELPKSHKAALKRVCENEKIAHFGEFGVAAVSANQLSQNEDCPIIVLERPLKLLHLTMAIAKDSPYKEALDYQLGRMIVTGILSRFRNRNFPLWGRTQKVSVQSVPAEQVAQVNLTLLVGIFLSVLALAAEVAKLKSNSTFRYFSLVRTEKLTSRDMNFEDFRVRGKEVIDFVCDLDANVEEKRVTPDVEPGFLARAIPKDPPKNGENLRHILTEFQEKILPGMTQRVHPGFHAYFPTGRGYPSLLAEIIGGGLGCIASSWASSPACTELEAIVLDWLAKAMSIPPHFTYSATGSVGGGAIQSSTSDCILVCMLAARAAAIKYLRELSPDTVQDDAVYLPKLVAYTSKEAHAAVQRCAHINMVKLRILDVDEQCSLRGPTLADQIHSDQNSGLHPFFVACTLGTTASCGFDNLKEIGPIVKKLPQCWLHVDSSYAGCGFICPELRYIKEGMEFADSFNVSCNKWLTVTYDCSCLWVKDRYKLTSSLITDPVLIDREEASVDYRNWGMQLTRKFRALKLWLTFRIFGVEGLQTYIRNHCKLAKEFEGLVSRDNRFEVVNDVRMGIVCFRLVGSDEVNQNLLASINKEGKVYMVPAKIGDRYVLRFCVAHPNATQSHIDSSWSIIQKHASDVLDCEKAEDVSAEDRKKYSFVETVSHDLYEKWKVGTLSDGAGILYHSPSHEALKKCSEDPVEVFHDVRAAF